MLLLLPLALLASASLHTCDSKKASIISDLLQDSTAELLHCTPLRLAKIIGRGDMAELLGKSKAVDHFDDDCSDTESGKFHDRDVVDSGKPVNSRKPGEKATAVMQAVLEGDLAALRRALQAADARDVNTIFGLPIVKDPATGKKTVVLRE